MNDVCTSCAKKDAEVSRTFLVPTPNYPDLPRTQYSIQDYLETNTINPSVTIPVYLCCGIITVKLDNARVIVIQ